MMRKPVTARSFTLIAYLASPLLVGAMTGLLYLVQQGVAQAEQARSLPRPFGIGFILIIAAATAVGGFGPGILTLALSVAALHYFLSDTSSVQALFRPRDLVEIVLLIAVGATVVYTVHKVRRLREEGRTLLKNAQEGGARLQAIMDAAPVGVVTCDASGTLDFANSEAERIWGHPLLRLNKANWGQYTFFTEDGDPISPQEMGMARVLSGKETFLSRQFIMQRPDGTRIWTNAVSTRMIHPKTGALLGAISAFLDITAVKEAEERLRDSEASYRFLTESVPQIVWTALSDGSYNYFNARWFEYTGKTMDETAGWEWTKLLHPDDVERTIERWQHCLDTGDDYNIEYRFLGSTEQTYRWFLGQGRAQRDENSKIIRWFGTMTDIHNQWEAQQQRERLLEEDARRARREALLNRIGQVQRGTINPDVVSVVATRELGQALDCDRCYLTALDLRRGVGEISKDWYQYPFESLQGEFRLGDTPIDYPGLFPNKQSIAVQDVRLHPGLRAAADRLIATGIRSFIAVPIYEGDLLIGTLTISMAYPHEWATDEVELVEAVAAQTRTTMEVASRLWREHNIAERLQEALTPVLPASVPGLKLASHYEAALAEASVGGDFFDVFMLEKGRVALVLGDLSGKGLSAASQIATVRNMLRFALYTNPSLAGALEQLNTVTADRELLTGFATLWIGIYECTTQTLIYGSAGHEPILVRKAETGNIETLPATGPVLGALGGVPFQEGTIALSAGDVILVYTDGLSEAGRDRRDFLGVEGLSTLLQAAPKTSDDPDAITRFVIAGVDSHARGSIHDDRCVLTAIVQPLVNAAAQMTTRSLSTIK